MKEVLVHRLCVLGVFRKLAVVSDPVRVDSESQGQVALGLPWQDSWSWAYATSGFG